MITYYQTKRHIFGDLKIEVFDSEGQSLGTIPEQQAPRPEPRDLVDAAEAAEGPARGDRGVRRRVGPRVLPGIYTVKMTKDKQVYDDAVARSSPDPRAKHSARGPQGAVRSCA